jgi:hypothetical protein
VADPADREFLFPPSLSFLFLFYSHFLGLFLSALQVYTWSMAPTTLWKSGRASVLPGGIVAYYSPPGMTASGARGGRCHWSVARRSLTTPRDRRRARTRTTAPAPRHLPHVPGPQSDLQHYFLLPRRRPHGRTTTSQQPRRLLRRRSSWAPCRRPRWAYLTVCLSLTQRTAR